MRLVGILVTVLMLLVAALPSVAAQQGEAEPEATPDLASVPADLPGLVPVYGNGAGFAVYELTFDGESMVPTIFPGERVLVDASAYDTASPLRGDIVVFYPPVDFIAPNVKRVVGLPGERIQVRGGVVMIDGEVLAEGIATDPTRCGAGETCRLVVPEGTIYVLGDNRYNSFDSRHFGPVPLEAVVGRVWYAHRDPAPRVLEPGA